MKKTTLMLLSPFSSREGRFKRDLDKINREPLFSPGYHHYLYRFASISLNTQKPRTDSLTENNTQADTTDSISRKKRILIVDDDMDIANLYKLSLEREGFVVNAFDDPSVVLSNYEAGAYELLILDIKMPQMSGFELYQKIKHIDNKVKVCFITAFEEYHSEFRKLFPKSREPDCVIIKPIELRNLTKIVKSQLDHN